MIFKSDSGTAERHNGKLVCTQSPDFLTDLALELERLQTRINMLGASVESMAEECVKVRAIEDRNAKLTAAALSALETLTANPAIDPLNVRAQLVAALEACPCQP